MKHKKGKNSLKESMITHNASVRDRHVTPYVFGWFFY
jgi:hypothetical protein